MESSESGSRDTAELRVRAEQVARERAARSPERLEDLTREEALRMLHELRVHQVEVEMQNEELRRAQAELETARTRYFDLYDLAPVGYCTLNDTGIILQANLCAATLLGEPRGVLVGQPITRFIVKQDQDVYYRHRKMLARADEPQTCELRMLSKEGVEFWAHLTAAVALDDNGAAVCRVVMTDVTEHKEAGAALEKARVEAQNEKLRLEAVMDVLPTGVAITDSTGGSIRVNPEFNRIWGGPRPMPDKAEDYATFKAWWVDTGRPVAPDEWASAQALRRGKAVVDQVLKIERLDGSHAVVINSASPIQDVDGVITGSAVTVQDISDLRKAQEAVWESERIYRAVGETIDYGVWVCDPDGRNIYASESFLKLVGLTQEQCSNFGWGDVLHPDDAERTMAAWRECVRTGGLWDIEHRFKGVDNQWHHVLARGVPIRDEHGEIVRWVGINLDITRLKGAEDEILSLNRELQARLEEMNVLLEILPVGVWVSNADCSQTTGNAAAYKILGLTPGADVSAPRSHFETTPGVRFFVDGVEVAPEEAPMLQVGRTGEPRHNFEYELLSPDGTRTTTYASVVPLTDARGEVRKVIGTYADFSARKRAEEALRKSEERLRLALQAGKMATWDWQLPGGETVWNDEHYRMFGYAVGAVEASYEAWTSRVHADDVAAMEAVFRSAMADGREYSSEFRACWPDGTVRWLWALGSFDRDATGQISRSYGVLLDVTEEKETGLRIEELNNALHEHVATVEAMNAELESYSHSVSHDLRTPLRFVNRIAHLLLHEPGAHLSNGATRQVNMILQATSEMAKLIENLLVFSEVGREPIRERRVDLRRIFQEAAKELEHAYETRKVEIAIQSMASCKGDRVLLKEVAVNLLANALKFTRRRSKTRITVGSTETDSEAVYFVHDNGVGFDMSNSDSLFLPFQRLHRQADFEGTGIGLALVRRIVERHGGRIWAEGEVDKGATFYFTLGGGTGQNNPSDQGDPPLDDSIQDQDSGRRRRPPTPARGPGPPGKTGL